MISHCADSALAQEERETGVLKTYTVEVEKTYRQVVKITSVSREQAMVNALALGAKARNEDAVLTCTDVRIVDEKRI